MFSFIAGKLGSKLLEWIIGGVVVAMLLGGGYFGVKYAWYSWFEKPKLEKEIRELQTAAIKYQAEIYKLRAQEKDKQVIIKYRERRDYETKKIDQANAASGDADLDRIARDYGMLPANPASPVKKPGVSPRH